MSLFSKKPVGFTDEQIALAIEKADKFDAMIKEHEETKVRVEQEAKDKAEKDELTSLCSVLGLDSVTDFKTALVQLAENKKKEAAAFATATTETVPPIAPQTELATETPVVGKSKQELLAEKIQEVSKTFKCTASEAVTKIQETNPEMFLRD
jgi:hypothetical protein